jgi:hypothetical protein
MDKTCEAGFFNGSDFDPNPANPTCDQSKAAIRGLGIMLVILSGFALPLKARFTYLRYVTPMPQKNVQNLQSLYGLANVVYEMSIFVYGILKAVSPSEYLIGAHGNRGIDIVLVFYSVSFFNIIYFAALNLGIFLEGTMKIFSMPKKKQEQIKFLIGLLRQFGIIAPILGGLVSIFLFLDLSAYQSSMINDNTFNIVYLVAYYVIMTVQGTTMIALLTLVTEGTGEYLAGQDKTEVPNETVIKITGIHSTLRLQMKLTTIRVFISQSWIVFTAWSVLRRKFTYYFCIYYLLTYFTGLLSFKALWNFNSKTNPVPVQPLNTVQGPILEKPSVITNHTTATVVAPLVAALEEYSQKEENAPTLAHSIDV